MAQDDQQHQDDQQKQNVSQRQGNGQSKDQNNGGQGGDKKDDSKKEPTPEEKRKRTRAFIIFGVVLLIAAIGGVLYYLHARHFEDTDDAQVDGNLAAVGTRIDGTVTKVYVNNNQMVQAGALLAELDPRDQQVMLSQREAQLVRARGQLESQEPNVPITRVQSSTNISSAQADVDNNAAQLAASQRDRDRAAAQVVQQAAAAAKADKDLERYTILVKKQELSKTDYDMYVSDDEQENARLQANQAQLAASDRTVDQRRAQLLQAQTQLVQNERIARPQIAMRKGNVIEQEGNLKNAEAQVQEARLHIDYTKIYAPVTGVAMSRTAQIGTRVQAGSQLLTIAETNNIWITANFKETQLLNMQPQQAVKIHIDALDKDFSGKVTSIGGATGSIASTLPPENATGNYVKVVQRIPVRIDLDPNQDGVDRLRPGMSAEPKVTVR